MISNLSLMDAFSERKKNNESDFQNSDTWDQKNYKYIKYKKIIKI